MNLNLNLNLKMKPNRILDRMSKRVMNSNLLQVWGMGNALLGADAVGCRVAQLLRERGEGAFGCPDGINRINCIDCGPAPENHTAALRKNPPQTLLIVDAADMGLSPGEYRKLSINEWGSVAELSHGLRLSLLLGDFAFEITVLGIQPSTLQWGAPLSEAVEKAARRVAGLIAEGRWNEIEPFEKKEF